MELFNGDDRAVFGGNSAQCVTGGCTSPGGDAPGVPGEIQYSFHGITSSEANSERETLATIQARYIRFIGGFQFFAPRLPTTWIAMDD